MQAQTCSGKTSAKLIIESVTPLSSKPEITIRNIGGQTANLTNYRLEGSQGKPMLVGHQWSDIDGLPVQLEHCSTGVCQGRAMSQLEEAACNLHLSKVLRHI